MNMGLSKFLIDVGKLDEELLEEIVEPFLVGIGQGSGAPIFKPGFGNLPSDKKMLVTLLAAKISHHLKQRENEELPTVEVEKFTNLPGGTVRPTLIILKERGLVNSNLKGYFVPNHMLPALDVTGSERMNQDVSTVRRSSTKGEPTQGFVMSSENFEKYSDLLLGRGNYLKRALLVIKIARDQGVDGLSPGQIEKVLKEQVRSPISSKNLSYVLGRRENVGLTSRVKIGKGFAYKIMRRGEQLVNGFVGITSGDDSQMDHGGVPEQ